MGGISKEAEQILRQRQVRLTELTKLEGWTELKQELERKRSKHLRLLSGQLMSGKEVNQREIDRVRGFWAGANWVFTVAEQAEASLEKAMRRALAMAESDEIEESEK